MTEIVQLVCAASDAGQVLVWANEVGLLPVRVKPVMERGALPVLLSVMT